MPLPNIAEGEPIVRMLCTLQRIDDDESLLLELLIAAKIRSDVILEQQCV